MSDNRPVKGLLLDWDGTLLDSFGAQVVATQKVFASLGASWSQARFMAYPTDWRAHYRAAGIPETHLPDASAAYRLAYAEQPTRLRPHAKRVLRRLSDAGIALAVVTSGVRDRVTAELRRAGLEDVFHELVTFEDVREPKPSPEGFTLAISKLGMIAAQTAAIGDTAADVLAAQAAGVRHILIRSPYTTQPYRKGAAGSWIAVERQLRTELGIEAG